MLNNMAAARTASEQDAEGVHDYPHGANYRHYRNTGLLDGGSFVQMNYGTDGFQLFRQNGFEGWPVTATPLCLSPDQRTRINYQLLLVVTPGPRQPVDITSFLHPIAGELNELAKGTPGLILPTSTSPVIVRNFTTDQPAGDKITGFKGVNSYIYNRLRIFKGIYVPSNCHVYYPPKDPASGIVLFQVHNDSSPRRTAASITASAAAVEDVRAEGKSLAFQTRLEQESGLKGYSLFFAPSPRMRATYPYLQDLWDMGPTAAPYDTMHLVLLNVVPQHWKLFAGLKLVNKKADEDYFMTRATVALFGREFRRARQTVPMAQARFLRNIEIYHKSVKAVVWLHFNLRSREVLLAGRITHSYINLFMALSRVCRMLFRPRGVTRAEIEEIEKEIKYFVSNYYARIYGGTAERLSLCLSTIATLLDFFLCFGRAARPGPSGSVRWNARLVRSES